MKKFFLLAVGLTCIGVLLSLLKPPVFEIVEKKLYDIHFALRGTIADTGRIVLVSVDEKSLQSLGRWPWPRDQIGGVFDRIIERGARMVVPDIFFADPSSGPHGQEYDQALADILHRRPNIFMGYFFLQTPEELAESSLSEESLKRNFRNLLHSSLPVNSDHPQIRGLPGLRTALGIQDTLPKFSNLPGGARHGFFNLLNDPDGTVRATPLLVRYKGIFLPSLALQAALNASGATAEEFFSRIRLQPNGDLLINYRGRGAVFPRVSMDDFMKGQESVSLKDKIVVVGATAAGLVDNRPTPVGPAVSSDALMAQIIDNLLKGDFLRRDRLTEMVSLSLILVSGLLLGFAVPRMKPVQSFLFFAGIETGLALLIHLVFLQFRWILQNIYPLFSGLLVYGGTALYGYLVQDREKRFISDTFQHYLSPDVIQELTSHPEKVRLGGERKELTVFFSDIRDFATIVETTPAEVLVDFLNGYLTPVTDIIFEEKGLLDKYIGDCVMAVFGAPLPEPDHPRLACEAGVRILRLLKSSRERWERDYKIPDLRIGIGINTGTMTVGNMGSDRRFDYTVMGDAVNLASRLEGLNKFYGTSMIVSHSTYEKAKDHFPFRELDQVQVKGKKESVRIYELPVDPSYDQSKLFPLYAEGLKNYREGKFREARALFEKCLTAVPDDGPSRLFLKRCQQLEEHPPETWEGVTAFLEK